MSRKILVFDTTLRDGEQVPGAKLNLNEKLEVARQLLKLNVDIIEAGFSASSPGDFQAVEAIAREIQGPMITALARAVKSDIDAVYHSVKVSPRPMIHIVLGTSDIHVQGKFNKSKDDILAMGVEAVKYAKTLLPEVQYSTEDATRSDFEYLWRTIEAVVKAGATMINVPDTVGFGVPEEFGELIKKINYRLKNLNDRVVLSVHCHNDTGLATANTLIAIKNGADKVECTINGIGERAGNAALEEVVMGLKLRPEYYGASTEIVTTEISRTSKLVSNLMGLEVQVNKAITGENAFAHSSGIHQDGLLKSRQVYEVIDPRDVGAEDMEMVLTARSGRHAFRDALSKIGFGDIEENEFNKLFDEFLVAADKKKEIYYHDLYQMAAKYYPAPEAEPYVLEAVQVISNDIFPSATVKIKRGSEVYLQNATADSPIDALYTAIQKAVDMEVDLQEFKINSIARGKKALGRVSVKLAHAGKTYTARAVENDIIKASAIAFLNGINSFILGI